MYLCGNIYMYKSIRNICVLHTTVENKLQFNIRDKLSNLCNTKVIVKYIKRVWKIGNYFKYVNHELCLI